MLALISDIHGNLEALTSVLDDIAQFPVDALYCLGDIVGYGPDPESCIDIIIEKAVTTIMGNHDYALLHGPTGFNPVAAEVIYLTRQRMKPHIGSDNRAKRSPYLCASAGALPECLVPVHSKSSQWIFIENLPKRFEKNDLLFVHASPLEPITEYVFPDAFICAWSPERILELMSSIKRLCFCGHTHIPCAIASDFECIYPSECDYRWALNPAKKYIINTGSVGQPRDHDKRACYLLFDEKEQTIEWRRVEYDIAAVVKKSEAMCGKDTWCAQRLLTGR